MKKILFLSILVVIAAVAFAQQPSGKEILQKVDRNMFIEQAVRTNTMIIHGRSAVRTIKSKVWFKGEEKAFVEYLSPPREKGKKMLKIGDKLWNYTPEPNDRIITIAGHLLRQSVMGSDLSYEDITENEKLYDVYDAKVVEMSEAAGRSSYVLELTALKQGLAYHKRKIWVDAERWVPLREERFAKSGRMLKTYEALEVKLIEGRWLPVKVVFKDMLSKGKGTEYIVDTISFDVDIPDYKFSKASLKK